VDVSSTAHRPVDQRSDGPVRCAVVEVHRGGARERRIIRPAAEALGVRRPQRDVAAEDTPARQWRVGRLLLLRSTTRTKAVVAQHASLMQAAYPALAADLYAALTSDQPWPGDGLLWCRVEGSHPTILARPPRGLLVARQGVL